MGPVGWREGRGHWRIVRKGECGAGWVERGRGHWRIETECGMGGEIERMADERNNEKHAFTATISQN